jgi:hypothetical protein
MEKYPSWILRNYLIAIENTFKLKKFSILCIREKNSFEKSIIFNVILPDILINFEKLNFVGNIILYNNKN